MPKKRAVIEPIKFGEMRPDEANVMVILTDLLLVNPPTKAGAPSSESYDALLRTKRKAYEESGIPISKDEAKRLVWEHPLMPSPSKGKPDKRAFQKHFDSTINTAALYAIVYRALLSVEEVRKIEKEAETSSQDFDALRIAVAIANNPEFDSLVFPTKRRLSRWFFNVECGPITRQTRHKRGPDPHKNSVRDEFLHDRVQDLMSCGLPKSTNDKKKLATPSAYGVVAEVCGLATSTIRMAFNKIEKLSS